jgi:Methyltransferase domain
MQPHVSGCRLCGAATARAFNVTVLSKYDVVYQTCTGCGSLQSEPPYWLPEAYSDPSTRIDPGSARRTLDCFVLVDIIARLFKCRTLLDFGGNTGFLCRLLRDRGYSAYSFDRYATPTYVPQFIGSPADRYDLLSAFEVIEHFDQPLIGLDQIFGAKPRIVLASTELYTDQGADWWYLAPAEGQHVFLYSERAIRLIAQRYGYHVVIGRCFILFSRDPLSGWQKAVLGLLGSRVLQIVGGVSLMRRGEGSGRDFAALTSTSRSDRAT